MNLNFLISESELFFHPTPKNYECDGDYYYNPHFKYWFLRKEYDAVESLCDKMLQAIRDFIFESIVSNRNINEDEIYYEMRQCYFPCQLLMAGLCCSVKKKKFTERLWLAKW